MRAASSAPGADGRERHGDPAIPQLDLHCRVRRRLGRRQHRGGGLEAGTPGRDGRCAGQRTGNHVLDARRALGGGRTQCLRHCAPRDGHETALEKHDRADAGDRARVLVNSLHWHTFLHGCGRAALPCGSARGTSPRAADQASGRRDVVVRVTEHQDTVVWRKISSGTRHRGVEADLARDPSGSGQPAGGARRRPGPGGPAKPVSSPSPHPGRGVPPEASTPPGRAGAHAPPRGTGSSRSGDRPCGCRAACNTTCRASDRWHTPRPRRPRDSRPRAPRAPARGTSAPVHVAERRRRLRGTADQR
jgi:hypothetical protein